MTFGQRRAHKYMWLLLTILVPVVMVFSIKDLNIFSSNINDSFKEVNSEEVAIKVFENEIVRASLYENTLRINLKSTLKNSSSVIYAMNSSGEKSNILGQLTTAGTYNFKVKYKLKGIIISDDLKKIDITKFSF